MAPLLSRSSRSVAGITKEKSPTWVKVPQPSRNVLRDRMVQRYWLGISREVRLLVETLRSWQKDQYADIYGENEVLRTEGIHGFRAFVERAVGKTRSEREQKAILQTIQQSERNARRLSVDQRRAQMLLQGSGFLDISKLMEYKPPQENYNLWTRPRAAQLVLKSYDRISHVPEFGPAVCAHCSSIIRGTQFCCFINCGQTSCRKTNCPQPYCRRPDQRPISTEPLLFCETCKRASDHPGRHLRKFEKRCILREVVPPTRSRQICTCENQTPCTGDEREDLYFAVDGGYPHQRRCPVLKLKRRHELARVEELRRSRTSTQPPKDRQGRGAGRGADRGRGSRGRIQKASSRSVGLAAQVVTPPIQFGNVHMMLMVGTIIIENGVSDSNAGARISIRDPPQLPMVTVNGGEKNPMMSVSPQREIFQMYGGPVQPRRIKACMKQVVGGSFTGLCDADASTELDIINALVEGSRRCAFDPMKTQAYHDRNMTRAVDQVVSKLRVLIGEKVVRYFDFIVLKLFDPKIELTWNQITNHCQQFCARILDFRAFGSFLATTPACRLHVPRNPLYLASFVCPPGSYDSPRRIRPGTKNQAPNGLTEEYLLRFRCYGHHEDSDHVDTLREYWNDWGAFGGPLYKHQDLFPWDCTEAYRQGEPESTMKCNNCSITKHVWSYPFDAWSIAQLHLYRDISLYSSHGADNKVLTDDQWMLNRLNVLSALRALTVVTVAMAKTTSFRATCRWNRERRALTPDTASRLDRVKLSGIHRAQPHSHSFEQSKYHDCTLAKWALLSRKDQIKAYEKLRDYRAEQLTEIPPRLQPRGNRIRIPRVSYDMRNGQADRFDVNGEGQEYYTNDDVQQQISDSDTVMPSDSEEEIFEEEYGFEKGGGLIPSGFGPDPEDEYDDYYGTEESGGLIPDTFGADPDIHYHDPGTRSCDYERDDKWMDISEGDGIDNCRDTSNSRSIYQPRDQYERNESEESSIANSTIAREESRIAEIIKEFVAEGVPPSWIDSYSTNPDNPPSTSSVLNSYNRFGNLDDSGDLTTGLTDQSGSGFLSSLLSSGNNNDYDSGGWFSGNSYGNNNDFSSWGGSGSGGGSWWGGNNNNNSDSYF